MVEILPLPADPLAPLARYIIEMWPGITPAEALEVARAAGERRVSWYQADEIRERIAEAGVEMPEVEGGELGRFLDTTVMGRICNTLGIAGVEMELNGQMQAAAEAAFPEEELTGEYTDAELREAAADVGVTLLEAGDHQPDPEQKVYANRWAVSPKAAQSKLLELVSAQAATGRLDRQIERGGLTRAQFLSSLDDEQADRNRLVNMVTQRVELERPLDGSQPTVDGLRIVWKAERNDPCPCGSGAKYKRCCGS